MAQTGRKGYLYIKADGLAGAGAWLLLGKVVDDELQDEWGEATIEDRSSPFVRALRSLRDQSIEFALTYKKGDTNQGVVETA